MPIRSLKFWALVCAIQTVILAAEAAAAQNPCTDSQAIWTPWEKFHGAPEGQGGGLDISFSQGRFQYENGIQINYRIRNRYSHAVSGRYEMTVAGTEARTVGQSFNALAAGATACAWGAQTIGRQVTATRIVELRDQSGRSLLGAAGQHSAAHFIPREVHFPARSSASRFFIARFSCPAAQYYSEIVEGRSDGGEDALVEAAARRDFLARYGASLAHSCVGPAVVRYDTRALAESALENARRVRQLGRPVATFPVRYP